jgi:hypothetical protein
MVRAQELDRALSRTIERIPADQRDDLIDSFHTIDMLSQQLGGLSGFTRALRENLHSGSRVCVGAALEGVTLGELAGRIRSTLGYEADDKVPETASGDVDLF